MSLDPCHIEYDLSRRQRLVGHLGVWKPYLGRLILLGGAVAFLVSRLITVSPWFALLSLFPLWLARGLVVGLLNVLFFPVQHMNIIIEENGLGFLVKGERFWVFLDGIIRIEKYSQDTWTIYHHNGTVINIPADAIDQRYVDHMQAMAEKRKTPEGVQAAIDRGRRIMEIEATEREERRRRKKERLGKSDADDGS
jgi:hypothetical protein